MMVRSGNMYGGQGACPKIGGHHPNVMVLARRFIHKDQPWHQLQWLPFGAHTLKLWCDLLQFCQESRPRQNFACTIIPPSSQTKKESPNRRAGASQTHQCQYGLPAAHFLASILDTRRQNVQGQGTDFCMPASYIQAQFATTEKPRDDIPKRVRLTTKPSVQFAQGCEQSRGKSDRNNALAPDASQASTNNSKAFASVNVH